MPLRGTTKHENDLGPNGQTPVALQAKKTYTAGRAESGHTGRKHCSAPSLKKKLTGDTWSHHQMSLSQEKHVEEFLCVWYPTWHGSSHTF